ncbi:hypothetical protein Q3G72_024874 [Acer saccharum]|nr:hypothetical protein Q3G72_024874 [Acer saccharum]
MINPIPVESSWLDVETDDNVPPPVIKRLPGRPKLARRREVDEQRRDRKSDGLKCGLCREFGYSRSGASGSFLNAMGSIDSQEMSMTALENSAAGGSQLLYGGSTQNLVSTTSQPPQAVETLQMHINHQIEGTQSSAILGSST